MVSAKVIIGLVLYRSWNILKGVLWLVYSPGIIKREIHLATNRLIRLTLIYVHML